MEKKARSSNSNLEHEEKRKVYKMFKGSYCFPRACCCFLLRLWNLFERAAADESGGMEETKDKEERARLQYSALSLCSFNLLCCCVPTLTRTSVSCSSRALQFGAGCHSIRPSWAAPPTATFAHIRSSFRLHFAIVALRADIPPLT